MKLYLIITKKRLAVVLAGIVILLILIGQFATEKSKKIDGSTHQLREQYIKNLGYEIDKNNITYKDISVPLEFDIVYKEYNELQKQAGFNLEKFKGEKAKVYTYVLENHPDKQIHLIINNGNIIGGDIASVKLNGEMEPLK